LDEKNFNFEHASIILIIVRKLTAFFELRPCIEDRSTGQLLFKKIPLGQLLPLQQKVEAGATVLQLQLIVELELLSELDQRSEFRLEISHVEFIIEILDF